MREQIETEGQISLEAAQTSQYTPVAVSVRGVSKTFVSSRKVVEALHPVDLEVAAGEFVCFLGPSGCGKSTLLQPISLSSNLSKPRTSNRWWAKLLRQIGFYILLLLAWEGLARSGIWPSFLFAGPVDVATSLFSNIQNGVLLTAILTSVAR